MPSIPRKCPGCGVVYWGSSDRYEAHFCKYVKHITEPTLSVAKKEVSKPIEKKKLNDFKCKCCNKAFQCTHKHRVYCSPECHHHDKVK